MKSFENEWILEHFDTYPSYHKKRMFGGLAVYLFDKMMMIIVEPTQSGRWDWHGILFCTEFENQESIQKQFPSLIPHDILKKWLFLGTDAEDFESTVTDIAELICSNDARFGIIPKQKSTKKKTTKKKVTKKTPLKKTTHKKKPTPKKKTKSRKNVAIRKASIRSKNRKKATRK